MKIPLRTLSGLMLVLALVLTSMGSPQAKSEVALMTKDELKAMMDDPDLVILDVRKGKDWTSSEFKIKGAVHAKPKEYASWAGNHSKSKKFVLYCA